MGLNQGTIPKPSRDEPPLFVDLDGTLIRGDLLLESFLILIKRQPLMLFIVPLWLFRGRAYLKQEIARRADVHPDGLVYNDRLLERLREERELGRTLVLATASNRKYADAIAAHLGIFDTVLASDELRNLKGQAKADAILAHTGGNPFDYIGNEGADIPIWRKARKVICVDTSPGVVRAVRAFTEPEELERIRKNRVKLLLKGIRVHQWTKNVLIFVPLLAAHRLQDVNAWINAGAAFVAFSLCASSVYVLNDLTDLRSDRLHPRKRKRPFAAGDLGLLEGMALIPALLGTAFAIALLLLPIYFVAVLAIYYVCSMVYNFAAKERVVWDVLMLAMLYTLRVIAGATAVPVPPSFWLLAFSLFLFLSLALAKRYSEMFTMVKAGRREAAGRGYVTDDMPALQSMGISSGFVAVLVIALYINSAEVHSLYTYPYALWGVCPLLLFWITRVWLQTHRGEMHDDPIVYALKDRTSLVIGLLVAACLVGATMT